MQVICIKRQGAGEDLSSPPTSHQKLGPNPRNRRSYMTKGRSEAHHQQSSLLDLANPFPNRNRALGTKRANFADHQRELDPMRTAQPHKHADGNMPNRPSSSDLRQPGSSPILHLPSWALQSNLPSLPRAFCSPSESPPATQIEPFPASTLAYPRLRPPPHSP